MYSDLELARWVVEALGHGDTALRLLENNKEQEVCGKKRHWGTATGIKLQGGYGLSNKTHGEACCDTEPNAVHVSEQQPGFLSSCVSTTEKKKGVSFPV